ncbi:MAG: MFS transporter [Telluria sp.]|nr:MFS transporter [Telluria sp.]
MSSFSNGFSVLRHRDFTLYMTARVLSTIAVLMQSVAIGWQVYASTGDVFDLGLVGLAQFAPFLALILVAGHVADRYNRRNIIATCFGMQLTCALLLLWYTLGGFSGIGMVLGVLVLFGGARAFMTPASQAIVVNMVPPESLGKAVALSTSAFQLAVIVGPTLGGLLYLAGPGVVYGVVATLLVGSISLMLLTRPIPQARNLKPISWHSLLEGMHFVRSRPVVLGAISLDLFAVLFGGATALLPAIAHDILHVGPTGLGLLRTAIGVGAALTAVALAFRPITRKVGRAMFAGVAVFACGTIVLGLSGSLALSLAALFLMGAGDMISVYVRHMLVQLETPDAIRGRVSAVNAVFIGASNELGEFESGLTAGWFGLVPALVLGGAATLVVTALWWARFPVLRKMDRFPEPNDASAPAKEAASVA